MCESCWFLPTFDCELKSHSSFWSLALEKTSSHAALLHFFHLCDINFHSHLTKWNCEHIFSIFPQPSGNHQKDVDMTNVSETEQKTFHVSVSVCLLITMNFEFLHQFCAHSYWWTVTWILEFFWIYSYCWQKLAPCSYITCFCPCQSKFDDICVLLAAPIWTRFNLEEKIKSKRTFRQYLPSGYQDCVFIAWCYCTSGPPGGSTHAPAPPPDPALLSMRKGNTEAALECNVYILNFGRFFGFGFGLWCFTVVNSFDNRRKAHREEEMADEAPFQFLHQEMIQYIYKSNDQGEVRTWIRFLFPGIISYYNIVTVSNSHSLRKVEEISPN